MYYSAGNYEAFAHPEKPNGVDSKTAYIIGSGLAGLSAAFYLVRDGQMKGENMSISKLFNPTIDRLFDTNRNAISIEMALFL